MASNIAYVQVTHTTCATGSISSVVVVCGTFGSISPSNYKTIRHTRQYQYHWSYDNDKSLQVYILSYPSILLAIPKKKLDAILLLQAPPPTTSYSFFPTRNPTSAAWRSTKKERKADELGKIFDHLPGMESQWWHDELAVKGAVGSGGNPHVKRPTTSIMVEFLWLLLDLLVMNGRKLNLKQFRFLYVVEISHSIHVQYGIFTYIWLFLMIRYGKRR